jgi:GNAT superfamily N-acetyltransferase
MRFRRDRMPLPEERTTLRLERVEEDASALHFARLVRVGYDLPESIEPIVADAWRCGWECWLAHEAREPVAAAALYAAQGIGYLSFAATLPEHRCKGAQSALLARRILRASELGCDRVVAETGELRPDLPSNSYRNIPAGRLPGGRRDRELAGSA